MLPCLASHFVVLSSLGGKGTYWPLAEALCFQKVRRLRWRTHPVGVTLAQPSSQGSHSLASHSQVHPHYTSLCLSYQMNLKGKFVRLFLWRCEESSKWKDGRALPSFFGLIHSVSILKVNLLENISDFGRFILLHLLFLRINLRPPLWSHIGSSFNSE